MLAGRIVELLGEPFFMNGNVVNIGASIGIALAPEHGFYADDLLKMADLALYHAKSLGRNRYAMFEPVLGEAVAEKHNLDNELRRALARGEFELHFQPIVDTKTLKMCSAEALVRWRHPKKGLIAPDRFIPFAEETGLILKIGEWVLQKACIEAVKWPSSMKVAVNLSAVQLRSATLLDQIICVLAETGLPPERLELEVTETALIEYGTEAPILLKKLRNLGITVALDDFGTGYSSLSQLTMFPFDKIKIDKSFTRNMTNRADCAAIISAVLALAQSLDIHTTAEGVEKDEQLRILTLAGVTTVQGFLIHRPCPAWSSTLKRPSSGERCRMPHNVGELPNSNVGDNRAQPRARDGVPAASQSLIDELEEAIAKHDLHRRAAVMRRLTDFFIVDGAGLSEEHVATFDDVMSRLIVAIDKSARAEFGEMLTRHPNAPKTSRILALDDEIAVAAPVLAHSRSLDDATLIETAKTKSQDHLFAISLRQSIGEAVTDVLVERGTARSWLVRQAILVLSFRISAQQRLRPARGTMPSSHCGSGHDPIYPGSIC